MQFCTQIFTTPLAHRVQRPKHLYTLTNTADSEQVVLMTWWHIFVAHVAGLTFQSLALVMKRSFICGTQTLSSWTDSAHIIRVLVCCSWHSYSLTQRYRHWTFTGDSFLLHFLRLFSRFSEFSFRSSGILFLHGVAFRIDFHYFTQQMANIRSSNNLICCDLSLATFIVSFNPILKWKL
jgi:hypothetical protein